MKRIISIILAAFFLAGLIAACSSGGGGNTATDAPPTSAQASAAEITAAQSTTTEAAAAESTTAGEAATESAATEQTTAAPETTAPQAPEDQEKTLSVACVRFSQHVDWDQMLVWQKFEEDTGIKVEWIYLNVDGLQETRNLMIATGDIPEAFNGAAWTADEVAKYSREGIFVAIDDYLPQYAPNTVAFYEKNPDIKQALVMPDGLIYGWPRCQENFGLDSTLMFRKAWVDELGIDMPKTPQELMALLLAMKERYDSNMVYSAEKTSWGTTNDLYNILRSVLQGAWGLGNRGSTAFDFNYYFDADPGDPTKVRFWGADPRLKEVNAFMHEMYTNGLIDPDIVTQDAPTWGAKLNLDPPKVGMVTTTVLGVYLEGRDRIGEPDEFVGLDEALTGPYGDQLWASARRRVSRIANFVITNKCKNIPIAVEFADYWMDNAENTELFFYGIEGEYWEWDPGHTYRIKAEWLTDDPQGRSADQMNSTYTSQPGGFYMGIIPYNYDPAYAQTIAGRAMAPYLPPVVWEQFNYTEDEMQIISTIGSDIRTYFEEANTSFVNGTLDIETQWDTYVSTLYNMGLQRLIDINQATYDRYIAAGGKVQ